MALTDHEEYHISIVEPYDSYDYSQAMLSVDDAVFVNPIGHADDELLSPAFHSPSYFSDSFSPSSESDHSFTSSVESPLWYSPTSSYQPSVISSPYSNTSDDLEFPQPTVAPRDITSNLFEPSFLDSTSLHEEPTDSIEPLFEESTEDAPSLAIDGLQPQLSTSTLFGGQKATDLRISIPNMNPLPRPLTSNSHYSTEPISGPSGETHHHGSEHPPSQAKSGTPAQYLGVSNIHSPTPKSSSSSPKYGEATRLRRRSLPVIDSVRSPTSPSRVSPRHHPYRQPAMALVAGEEVPSREDMTQDSYELIKEVLQSHDKFSTFSFDGRSLPPLHKSIVGSDQTRKASQVRRTDTSAFCCPIPNCGSTLTKRHNLKHHIESHFLDPIYECKHCKSRMRHNASLRRHERGCGKKNSTTERNSVPKGKKRGKKT